MDYTASLGFHAPWLPNTPDGRSYSRSDLAIAFAEGQRAIRELARYNRMSLALFVELLGKGPDELYMIDTPYRAAKLGINLSGYFDSSVYSKVGWTEQEVDLSSAVYPSKEAALWLFIRLMLEEHHFTALTGLGLNWSVPGSHGPVLNAPPVYANHEPPDWENVQTFEQAFDKLSEKERATWLSNIKVQFTKNGDWSKRPEVTFTVPIASTAFVATFTATRGVFVKTIDLEKEDGEVDVQEVTYEYTFPPGLKLMNIPAWLRRNSQGPLVPAP